MKKEDFLETCVVLGCLDRDSILKTILKEKCSSVLNSSPNHSIDEVDQDLPQGLALLVHNPTPDNFADYAFGLCSLEDNKETIVRHLLSIHFDAAVQSAVHALRGPRVRTRQSKQKAEEELPGSSSRKKRAFLVAPPSGEPSGGPSGGTRPSGSPSGATMEPSASSRPPNGAPLPSKLNLFTDDKKVMTTLSDIIQKFFPGLVPWTTEIYRRGSFFVLVVMDGRHGNSWTSAGVQNKLTWFTTREDVDRQVFDKITSNDVVVHVVRKRNSELRYMGKCQKTEEVDREEGSCVMYVA